MNDLISRSALLEKVQFRLPIDNHNAEVISGCVDITRRIIEEAPAVDAVEVVRCKDCYYFRMYHCKHPQWESPQGFPMVSESDFCSYGERRNGND